MKVDLAGVIRDVQLTTLAFAIALGWSLYRTAWGVATFVETVTLNSRFNPTTPFTSAPVLGGGLTWVWHHHIFTFGQFVLGLIELGTVLLVALLVRRVARSD